MSYSESERERTYAPSELIGDLSRTHHLPLLGQVRWQVTYCNYIVEEAIVAGLEVNDNLLALQCDSATEAAFTVDEIWREWKNEPDEEIKVHWR